MTGVILLLFGLGLADTLRAPVLIPDEVGRLGSGERRSRKRRDVLSWVISVALTVGLGWSLGSDGSELILAGLAVVVVVGFWLVAPRQPVTSGPLPQLAFLAVAFAIAFAVTMNEPSGGEFQNWYEGLEWGFVDQVSHQQFAMALVCGLYALAAANRVVTLVLEAAGTPRTKGEEKLKGGRLLGPMERLIVAGMVLSGDPAGAAIVFAAKGLLRLPNVRDAGKSSEEESCSDPAEAGEQWTVTEYTEYFLIGTFASLLLAATLALLVLGVS